MLFYNEGIAVAKQAVAADARASGEKGVSRAASFREAQDLYAKAVEYFETGLRFDKDDSRKNRMTLTATSYMEVCFPFPATREERWQTGGGGRAACVDGSARRKRQPRL